MNNSATFYIKAVLVAAANMKRYIDQIIIEEKISGTAKKFLTDTRKKAESIERDICLRTTPELAAVIRKEIADNWETIAFDNIIFMALTLDDERLRRLEQTAEDLMNEQNGCKCVRFTGGDKWYPNGCTIHPNGQ